MIRPFKSVENVRPGRSVFDLSYSKAMSADMGLLYPIMCDEVVPGDHWSISHSIVARAMPLVAPILHQIDITVHSFFVPYRLIWEDWEDFISGGVDGDDASVLPRMDYPGDSAFDDADSLWDYLGFPRLPTGSLTATDTLPLKFPQLAYSLIWNEYYRDETLQTEIDLSSPSAVLLRRAWTKDYFTSALPWAQRGTAPAFPLTGSAPLTPTSVGVDFDFKNTPVAGSNNQHVLGMAVSGDVTNPLANTTGLAHTTGNDSDTDTYANDYWNRAGVAEVDLSGVSADMSTVSSFDINTLRTAWQVQRWMERNARGGVRYVEFLRSHFGVAPKDETLQRPVYIGGMKAPVIISEVLQTSATDTGITPQGNLAGHGISVAQQKTGKYFATEYGLIMSLMSIMPKPMYHQGINRQWLRRTRYDFYFPEFSTLGEQAVEDQEIYWQATDALNKHVFGFQGRYDELRFKPNMTVGALRPNLPATYALGDSFGVWTLTRDFASLPALGDTFIQCNPSNRAWAVTADAPQFVMHIGNHIKAVRPIPAVGTPGLVDHH